MSKKNTVANGGDCLSVDADRKGKRVTTEKLHQNELPNQKELYSQSIVKKDMHSMTWCRRMSGITTSSSGVPLLWWCLVVGGVKSSRELRNARRGLT